MLRQIDVKRQIAAIRDDSKYGPDSKINDPKTPRNICIMNL